LVQADLEQDAIAFYWISGGAGRNVQFQTKYKGRVVKTEATFDVQSPTNVEMTSKTSDDAKATHGVMIDDNYGFYEGFFLHFGSKKGDAGIAWTGKVTAPGASGGEIAFVQREILAATATQDNKDETKYTRSSDGDFVLDTTFPYNPGEQVAASETGILQGGKWSDSPGSSLLPVTKVNTNDARFETYLMFKPDGTDSIWVTLRVLKWHWQGEAVKDAKGAWVFGMDPPPDASKNPDSKASTDLPTWTKNVKDVKYKKENPK